MRTIKLGLTVLLVCLTTTAFAGESKPNVLLIAIDDLNDWIGCMRGHPQAKTPNIDRLAARGVLFDNAHCQSPVCNPSRASMMTSLYPSTSGIYFLTPDLAASPTAKKNTLMPMRFQTEGYHVTGAGKIFHGRQNEHYIPNYAGMFGGFGPLPKEKISSFPGMRAWDWGAYPERDEQMSDHKIAAWAVEQLQNKQDGPLFLAVGFCRPHVPQYVPQKWFDLYPLDTLQLPDVLKDDLDDLSQYGINLTRLEHVAPPHDWVVKNNEWKPLIQSYLACVSFVDHQVGKLLDALDTNSAKEDTFVVLYSDHGFHLGEKERWAKRSLWEDGTRVPLIVAGPGVAQGKTCKKPVQLLDVYPTLLELTGLTQDNELEGHSLAALLRNPAADWPYMAHTSFGPGNESIRSERYRYIRYNDGSEEFYDHADDPHEWQNQISNPDFETQLKQHRSFLPKAFHPVLGTGSTGHKAFNASEAIRKQASRFDPLDWKRPVDNPVFTTTHGNNHDSVLFVDPELEYPYHLIISHTPEAAHLWRTKTFSWSSADWEPVSDQYVIGKHYEYDDGVKVDGTYYLYEEGIVFTFSGPLEEASGKWKAAGTFPHKECNDIGIYVEDGVFHMFGEHGHFPHGPDGTSLAHFTSATGLGDWKLVNAKAVDPNPDGGYTYGVGDATIAKINGTYYIFCDQESKGSPYKVVAWKSKDINKPFEYVGNAITPRSDEGDDWDNHRIQDPDIAFAFELGGYVMTCNMMDRDGNPGGNFPTLRGNSTRVIGVFYHNGIQSASGKAETE